MALIRTYVILVIPKDFFEPAMVLTQSDLLLIVHRFQVPEKRSTAKLAVVRVGPIASLEKNSEIVFVNFLKEKLIYISQSCENDIYLLNIFIFRDIFFAAFL
jgi:hypothetical protein